MSHVVPSWDPSRSNVDRLIAYLDVLTIARFKYHQLSAQQCRHHNWWQPGLSEGERARRRQLRDGAVGELNAEFFHIFDRLFSPSQVPPPPGVVVSPVLVVGELTDAAVAELTRLGAHIDTRPLRDAEQWLCEFSTWTLPIPVDLRKAGESSPENWERQLEHIRRGTGIRRAILSTLASVGRYIPSEVRCRERLLSAHFGELEISVPVPTTAELLAWLGPYERPEWEWDSVRRAHRIRSGVQIPEEYRPVARPVIDRGAAATRIFGALKDMQTEWERNPVRWVKSVELWDDFCSAFCDPPGSGTRASTHTVNSRGIPDGTGIRRLICDSTFFSAELRGALQDVVREHDHTPHTCLYREDDTADTFAERLDRHGLSPDAGPVIPMQNALREAIRLLEPLLIVNRNSPLRARERTRHQQEGGNGSPGRRDTDLVLDERVRRMWETGQWKGKKPELAETCGITLKQLEDSLERSRKKKTRDQKPKKKTRNKSSR